VQVRYAATAIENSKSARARGSYLRVSFKNTRETAQAINGYKFERAVTYLENVLEKKEAIPMRRYAGSTGRCAQGEWIPEVLLVALRETGNITGDEGTLLLWAFAERNHTGKQFGVSKARWPVKSAEFLLGLLKNAEANADTKGCKRFQDLFGNNSLTSSPVDTSNLIVKHIQVNQAPKQRRRTYRAHGRVSKPQHNTE
jgi:large subunit ribosomal protein L17e